MDIKTDEQLRTEDERKIQNYTFMSDVMMRVAFRDDLPFAQFVLRLIMQKDDLVLTEEKTQYDMKRLLGRSICLDVFGKDSEDKLYDFEIQNDDDGAVPRRARYHSSAMDVEFLNVREKFDELPETYVIFITEHDIIGEGKLIYHVERMVSETDKSFNDGEHIIYLNCDYKRADSDLAKLVHDFKCRNADDMFFKEMADKMRSCKETAKGVSSMRSASEEIREETRQQDALKFALRMLQRGEDSLTKIAELAELSVDDVRQLAMRYDVPINTQ